MKKYEIKKTENKICWEDIPVLHIDTRYWDTPENIAAQAQLCYNEKTILVHLKTIEKNARAVEKGPLGRPFRDSCLEFFFSPKEGDLRYFNFEFNPNGCLYLGFGSKLENSVRLLVEPEPVFKPQILKNDEGWEIYYEIPFEFIRRFFPGFEARPGKSIRANCYKCCDLSKPPHYMSWSPIDSEPLTFHSPEFFGIMEFSDR